MFSDDRERNGLIPDSFLEKPHFIKFGLVNKELEGKLYQAGHFIPPGWLWLRFYYHAMVLPSHNSISTI